mmetsp:Transcript_45106/g.109140  ORF Transcript_45106/g.109140 Transcript_45106/m.109140 type:complete len:180 (+) Transcript_45106:50-589(+)
MPKLFLHDKNGNPIEIVGSMPGSLPPNVASIQIKKHSNDGVSATYASLTKLLKALPRKLDKITIDLHLYSKPEHLAFFVATFNKTEFLSHRYMWRDPEFECLVGGLSQQNDGLKALELKLPPPQLGPSMVSSRSFNMLLQGISFSLSLEKFCLEEGDGHPLDQNDLGNRLIAAIQACST